jgi:hypothetical protein
MRAVKGGADDAKRVRGRLLTTNASATVSTTTTSTPVRVLRHLALVHLPRHAAFVDAVSCHWPTRRVCYAERCRGCRPRRGRGTAGPRCARRWPGRGRGRRASGWTGTAPPASSAGSPAAPESPSRSVRTPCGTRSSPPPPTPGSRSATCRKPPPTPTRAPPHALRPGAHQPRPPRHLMGTTYIAGAAR